MMNFIQVAWTIIRDLTLYFLIFSLYARQCVHDFIRFHLLTVNDRAWRLRGDRNPAEARLKVFDLASSLPSPCFSSHYSPSPFYSSAAAFSPPLLPVSFVQYFVLLLCFVTVFSCGWIDCMDWGIMLLLMNFMEFNRTVGVCGVIEACTS